MRGLFYSIFSSKIILRTLNGSFLMHSLAMPFLSVTFFFHINVLFLIGFISVLQPIDIFIPSSLRTEPSMKSCHLCAVISLWVFGVILWKQEGEAVVLEFPAPVSWWGRIESREQMGRRGSGWKTLALDLSHVGRAPGQPRVQGF